MLIRHCQTYVYYMPSMSIVAWALARDVSWLATAVPGAGGMGRSCLKPVSVSHTT